MAVDAAGPGAAEQLMGQFQFGGVAADAVLGGLHVHLAAGGGQADAQLAG